MTLPFKNLYVKVFILNIFGGIKGGNPNLDLEGVNFPFKNLYVKVFILNIFGEIKGGDPKFGIAQDCTSKKGVFLFFFTTVISRFCKTHAKLLQFSAWNANVE